MILPSLFISLHTYELAKEMVFEPNVLNMCGPSRILMPTWIFQGSSFCWFCIVFGIWLYNLLCNAPWNYIGRSRQGMEFPKIGGPNIDPRSKVVFLLSGHPRKDPRLQWQQPYTLLNSLSQFLRYSTWEAASFEQIILPVREELENDRFGGLFLKDAAGMHVR